MVKDYKVYIKIKTLRYKLYKEFQVLFVFERIWSSIIINFIVKLSKSRDPINNINYNNIFIIIEHLIKYYKFIPIHESYSTKDFVNTVV